MLRRVHALSLAAMLALAGCGASQGTAPASPAALVRATASAYYAALARQDAAAACAQITPAYWEATLSEARAALAAARGQHLPRGTCGHVLRYVFSLNPTSGSRLAKMRVTVRDVSFHGAGAVALVSDGRSAGEWRFVRSASGHWLIDCCTRSEARKLTHSFYRVPSVSMEPTLKPGQLVAADNAALRTRPPSLGEIVTLHAPTDPRCSSAGQGEGFPQPCGKPARSTTADVSIKRVVGLPGDRISLVGGRVVRNGVVEREPYILPCARGAAACDFPKPIVVPPGTYYVLGDNRGDSFDSRFFGPVPRASILGLVTP